MEWAASGWIALFKSNGFSIYTDVRTKAGSVNAFS